MLSAIAELTVVHPVYIFLKILISNEMFSQVKSPGCRLLFVIDNLIYDDYNCFDNIHDLLRWFSYSVLGRTLHLTVAIIVNETLIKMAGIEI